MIKQNNDIRKISSKSWWKKW